MSDLISRQVAISAMYERWSRTENFDGWGADISEECEEVLNALPSADRPTMNDSISRRAAIDMLEQKALEPDYYHNGEDWYYGVNSAIVKLYDVPSADRPTGEWIDMSNGGAIRTPWWESGKCDQCGKYGSKTWDYCPHCGAKMEVER